MRAVRQTDIYLARSPYGSGYPHDVVTRRSASIACTAARGRVARRGDPQSQILIRLVAAPAGSRKEKSEILRALHLENGEELRDKTM